MKQRLFISSVQKEFAAERRAVHDFVRADPLLGRFFDAFLFEDLPASDRRADDVYLGEVGLCAAYVGFFGREYGREDGDGLSPTEREFDEATALGKPRLIYVQGANDGGRDPKMQALIRKAGAQLIRRRFTGISDLNAALYASLVDYLESRGTIQDRPFEERPCPGATLDDMEADAIAGFVRRARSERQFPVPERTPMADVLAHLNLLQGTQPTNAAVLLFGRNPQRFVPCAEVRCMHFHGTEIQRPVPSYQIFKGRLFEQVDRAADFVLGVLNRSVGTRALSSQAPVAYEIPSDVIREAIVNAIAHRDYASPAAVQVSAFADRVEVWNPGLLPPPLTPERLRKPHSSIARNPRIAEALFLARYIEKYGTGTLMMIRESVAHSLPEPDFEQRAGEFVTTLGRDWLTEKVLAGLGLNERQRQAVAVAKIAGRITNTAYQQATAASRPTAIRDLARLVAKGIFVRRGAARSAYYTIADKRLINDSNDSRERAGENESEMTQMTQAHRGNSENTPRKRATNAPNGPRRRKKKGGLA